MYEPISRILALTEYVNSSTELVKKLTQINNEHESISTNKLNQLSSVMDQMLKIIEDILK